MVGAPCHNRSLVGNPATRRDAGDGDGDGDVLTRGRSERGLTQKKPWRTVRWSSPPRKLLGGVDVAYQHAVLLGSGIICYP